jgi:hypothetical protein
MVRAIESATFTHMKWKSLRVKGKCSNGSQHEFSLCELTFWKSWMFKMRFLWINWSWFIAKKLKKITKNVFAFPKWIHFSTLKFSKWKSHNVLHICLKCKLNMQILFNSKA